MYAQPTLKYLKQNGTDQRVSCITGFKYRIRSLVFVSVWTQKESKSNWLEKLNKVLNYVSFPLADFEYCIRFLIHSRFRPTNPNFGSRKNMKLISLAKLKKLKTFLGRVTDFEYYFKFLIWPRFKS